MTSARELLRRMFDAAIASAQPSRCVPSAAMAKPLEENWRGDVDIVRHWKAVHPFDAQTAFVWE
jgi:hypothetical protein